MERRQEGERRRVRQAEQEDHQRRARQAGLRPGLPRQAVTPSPVGDPFAIRLRPSALSLARSSAGTDGTRW
ncbi:FeoA domain-containing protein [Streptomyces sp. NPDC088725]|uniref:FeoA domain-containing protein n=1 Tax=Streptomyces sp. NPDC088725 TaxID=3365873 RepID=UPI0038064DC3